MPSQKRIAANLNAKGKRKPRFRVGQVVAFRGDFGEWTYDRIGSLRPHGRIYARDTAFLALSTARIEARYLRKLTKRERGCKC